MNGVKVLDLGRVIAAPYSAAMLGDLGADVLKIETPEKGDDARVYLPVDGYFSVFNRSKKGITLNLKKPESKEIFFKLVREADVLLENFRPGVMKKLGLDYEVLKEINPRLIYACVSGFGQEGPYSQLAGYDPLIQAMSGISSVTGEVDGDPVRCGASMCDVMAAINVSFAIVSALYYREKTGQGQMIDCALLDQGVLAMSSVIQIYLSERKLPKRLGNGYAAGVPGNLYHAKDGVFMYAGSGDGPWKKICESWGKPELAEDPRYKDRKARVQNRKDVDQMMEDFTANMTVAECIDYFRGLGLACGPVQNAEQVFNDPQVGINGVRSMFVEVTYGKDKKFEITGPSFRMSLTPPEVRSPAPTLGEHNAEVYSALGYSEVEIAELKENGVI